MEMGPQVNVEAGSSGGLMSCRDVRAGSAPIGALVANSAASAEQLSFEAGKLIDDIQLALSSDLSVAAKKAASLSLLLATKITRYQRPAPSYGGLAGWQQKKIQNYIRDRLSEALPIEDLAKVVGLSTSYFCRAFKESFTEPPHAYIIGLRIKHAQTLMMTSSESLSQIALACGLVDQSHLCKCFRQITGVTPGAWRRRNVPDRSSASAGPGCSGEAATVHSYSRRNAPGWLQP